jgi:hypothetical protein
MIAADVSDPYGGVSDYLYDNPFAVDIAEGGWGLADEVIDVGGGLAEWVEPGDNSWFDDIIEVAQPAGDVYDPLDIFGGTSIDWTSTSDDWDVVEDDYWITDCWGCGTAWAEENWDLEYPTFDPYYTDPIFEPYEPIGVWEPYVDTFGVDDLSELGERLGIEMPATVDEFVEQLGAGNTQDLMRHLGGNDLDDLVGALGATGAEALVDKLATDGQLGDFIDAADGAAIQGLLTKMGDDGLQGVLGRLDPAQTTDVLGKLIEANRPVALTDIFAVPDQLGAVELGTTDVWDVLDPVQVIETYDPTYDPSFSFFDETIADLAETVDYVVEPEPTSLFDQPLVAPVAPGERGIVYVEETIHGDAGDMVERYPDPALYEYDEQGNLLLRETGALVQYADGSMAAETATTDEALDFTGLRDPNEFPTEVQESDAFTTGLADPNEYPIEDQVARLQEQGDAPAAADDALGVSDVFSDAPAAASTTGDVIGDDVLGTTAMAEAATEPVAAAMEDDILGVGADAPALGDPVAIPDVAAVPDLPDLPEVEMADPVADLTAPPVDVPDVPDLPDVPDVPDAVDTAVAAADDTASSVDDMFNELN